MQRPPGGGAVGGRGLGACCGAEASGAATAALEIIGGASDHLGAVAVEQLGVPSRTEAIGDAGILAHHLCVMRRSCTDPSIVRSCAAQLVEEALPHPVSEPIYPPGLVGCPRRGPQVSAPTRWWSTRLAYEEPRPRSLAQTLASSLVGVPLRLPVATFQCCICLENIPVTSRLMMKRCGRDAHAACAECLKTYLRLRIEEGRVNELRCPCAGDDSCDALVSEEEIRIWLPHQICEKFRRFVLMDADPKLRACPRCSRLVSPDLAHNGNVVAEMFCDECRCNFCYYHSNAHAQGPDACAAYERIMVRQQLTEAGLGGTKPCPSCGFPTEKVSGCNHMTCRCKVNWCWACHRQLDNVGWHYNPANPHGCMQFQDELTTPRQGRLILICKVLALPAVLVATAFVIVFVLTLLSLFPLPALLCFGEVGFKVWIGVAGVLVAIPFLVFSLGWAVLGLLMWLLMLPFGATDVHLQFLLGAPLMTAVAIGEGLVTPGDRLDQQNSIVEPIDPPIGDRPEQRQDTHAVAG